MSKRLDPLDPRLSALASEFKTDLATIGWGVDVVMHWEGEDGRLENEIVGYITGWDRAKARRFIQRVRALAG